MDPHQKSTKMGPPLPPLPAITTSYTSGPLFRLSAADWTTLALLVALLMMLVSLLVPLLSPRLSSARSEPKGAVLPVVLPFAVATLQRFWYIIGWAWIIDIALDGWPYQDIDIIGTHGLGAVHVTTIEELGDEADDSSASGWLIVEARTFGRIPLIGLNEMPCLNLFRPLPRLVTTPFRDHHEPQSAFDAIQIVLPQSFSLVLVANSAAKFEPLANTPFLWSDESDPRAAQRFWYYSDYACAMDFFMQGLFNDGGVKFGWQRLVSMFVTVSCLWTIDISPDGSWYHCDVTFDWQGFMVIMVTVIEDPEFEDEEIPAVVWQIAGAPQRLIAANVTAEEVVSAEADYSYSTGSQIAEGCALERVQSIVLGRSRRLMTEMPAITETVSLRSLLSPDLGQFCFRTRAMLCEQQHGDSSEVIVVAIPAAIGAEGTGKSTPPSRAVKEEEPLTLISEDTASQAEESPLLVSSNASSGWCSPTSEMTLDWQFPAGESVSSSLPDILNKISAAQSAARILHAAGMPQLGPSAYAVLEQRRDITNWKKKKLLRIPDEAVSGLSQPHMKWPAPPPTMQPQLLASVPVTKGEYEFSLSQFPILKNFARLLFHRKLIVVPHGSIGQRMPFGLGAAAKPLYLMEWPFVQATKPTWTRHHPFEG